MGRIPREKKYVAVRAIFDASGEIKPESIIFADDDSSEPAIEYEIDRVLDKQRGCSVEVGGCGMKYSIQVCGKQSVIFFEPDGFFGRWFVEAKKR